MPLYFIAIVAPPFVNEQALKQKQYMFNEYGCKVALRSPAHITLVPPFNTSASNEAQMHEALASVSIQHSAFDIEITNYNYFAPRVIYLDVKKSTQLEQLKIDVEDAMLKAALPIKKETRPYHPHITIANRDLERKDFHAVKKHFDSQQYNAIFLADNVSILRSEREGWKVIDTIKLQDTST